MGEKGSVVARPSVMQSYNSECGEGKPWEGVGGGEEGRGRRGEKEGKGRGEKGGGERRDV